MILAYLLRYYRREGAEAGLEVVTVSLDEMARGGGGSTISSARVFIDTRWMNAGWSPTSRRCSMTTSC